MKVLKVKVTDYKVGARAGSSDCSNCNQCSSSQSCQRCCDGGVTSKK